MVHALRDHSTRELALEARIVDLGVMLRRAQGRSKRFAVEADADPLTGLANHRAFQERLGVEVERAQRYSRP